MSELEPIDGVEAASETAGAPDAVAAEASPDPVETSTAEEASSDDDGTALAEQAEAAVDDSAESAPANEAPVEQAPADPAPAVTAEVEDAPVEAALAEAVAVDEAPPETAPVEAAPADDAVPAETTEEVEETPVEAAPAEAVAVDEAPVETAPAETAVEDAPVEATPVDSAPAEEAAAEDAAPAATAEVAVEGEASDSAAAPVADAEGKPPPPGVPGLDWYIIHAYSGFENKVRESLRTRADAFGFGDSVGEMLIPTEEVVELRAGKRVTTKRLLYPGYVLVQLDLDDELWHVVKNTPRVTGFVGGGHKPNPLTADEVNQILYRQTASAERPRPKMSFQRNDQVKIVDGPFANFSGTVEEVNEDRATLKVMVTIFGRGTPVELEYFQVEKEG